MKLFAKKKNEEKTSCCCGAQCSEETMAKAEEAKAEGSGIKILGSGCAKCNQLEEATKTALSSWVCPIPLTM
jgi:hypothetical protein